MYRRQSEQTYRCLYHQGDASLVVWRVLTKDGEVHRVLADQLGAEHPVLVVVEAEHRVQVGVLRASVAAAEGGLAFVAVTIRNKLITT